MSTRNPMPERAALNRKRAYLTAVASFGAKGIFAFIITYWLANSLRVEDLALWATLFSLGMILSVADLGVGQLVLTTFHEGQHADGHDRLITNSVAAMVVLSALMFLLTSLAISFRHVLDGVRWRHLLVATILLRLIVIPYGAYLQALERYHERKLAEAISYGVGAIFILWGIKARADVSALLLGLNAILTLGSLAIAVRAVQLGAPRLNVKAIVPQDMRRVFTESFPYFVNNVSGLAIYGGFIALSALVLDAPEVARLSLLHSVVFMHTFQVFDLVFRSVQPRMRDEALMQKLKVLVALAYVGGLAASALVGVWLFAHIFRKYQYTSAELALYTTFVFLEVYYLMLTSAMQMRSSMKKSLQWMSIVKAAAFVAVLIVASASAKPLTILLYTFLLVLYSASMAYMGRKVAGQASSLKSAPVR